MDIVSYADESGGGIKVNLGNTKPGYRNEYSDFSHLPPGSTVLQYSTATDAYGVSAQEGDKIVINRAHYGITGISDVNYNSNTGELTVNGYGKGPLAILENATGFDVNQHITLTDWAG